MKSLAILLVLLLAYQASAATLTRFGKASETHIPKDLKVLVWNIHKGSDDRFTYDYQRLVDDKHLALLQEANLTQSVKDTLETQALSYTHATSFISPFKKVRMGLATGSVARELNATGLVSTVREVRAATPKAVLLQTYALEGKTKRLLVANVHAINFVPNVDYVKHIEQIALAIATHQGPMIVGGDFNTWNVERVGILDKIFGALRLRRVAFPDGRTEFPHLGRIFGMQTGGPLDQVYVRELAIAEADVNAQVTSSDHKPLELRLSVR